MSTRAGSRSSSPMRRPANRRCEGFSEETDSERLTITTCFDKAGTTAVKEVCRGVSSARSRTPTAILPGPRRLPRESTASAMDRTRSRLQLAPHGTHFPQRGPQGPLSSSFDVRRADATRCGRPRGEDPSSMPNAIDRTRLRDLMGRELARFEDEHPRSRELFERAKANLLAGVPMPWMSEWAGPFPVFVAEAHGARFTDVDGHEYVDLCLGDTGSDDRPRPEGGGRGDRRAGGQGHHAHAPDRGRVWVGAEMQRRFGLPFWQFCLTATDANRFTIRLARAITGRPKILVFNYCYHGSVDETILTIEDGVPGPRPGNVGRAREPDGDHTRRRVQRRRRARGGARARGRRVRPRRAGPHEHRDRPARTRVPRRAPTAYARARHATS